MTERTYSAEEREHWQRLAAQVEVAWPSVMQDISSAFALAINHGFDYRNKPSLDLDATVKAVPALLAALKQAEEQAAQQARAIEGMREWVNRRKTGAEKRLDDPHTATGAYAVFGVCEAMLAELTRLTTPEETPK